MRIDGANWVTQASFAPPLVAIAAKKGTASCDGIRDRGDHTIFVGEVIEAGVHRQGDPLTLKETGLFYGG